VVVGVWREIIPRDVNFADGREQCVADLFLDGVDPCCRIPECAQGMVRVVETLQALLEVGRAKLGEIASASSLSLALENRRLYPNPAHRLMLSPFPSSSVGHSWSDRLDQSVRFPSIDFVDVIASSCPTDSNLCVGHMPAF